MTSLAPRSSLAVVMLFWNALDGWSQALKNRPHGRLSTLKNCIWLVFKGKIRLKCCFCKHFFFGSFSLLLCTLHFWYAHGKLFSVSITTYRNIASQSRHIASIHLHFLFLTYHKLSQFSIFNFGHEVKKNCLVCQDFVEVMPCIKKGVQPCSSSERLIKIQYIFWKRLI